MDELIAKLYELADAISDIAATLEETSTGHAG